MEETSSGCRSPVLLDDSVSFDLRQRGDAVSPLDLNHARMYKDARALVATSVLYISRAVCNKCAHAQWHLARSPKMEVC